VRDHLLGRQLPAEPLGESSRAKVERERAERAPRRSVKLLRFERIGLNYAKDTNGVQHDVTEADCRQIKGAAQGGSPTSLGIGERPQGAAPVAAPPIAERPIEGVWVPKVGDRVRWTTGSGWEDCTITGFADVTRKNGPIPGALLKWGSAAEGLIPFAELELLSPIAERKGEWIPVVGDRVLCSVDNNTYELTSRVADRYCKGGWHCFDVNDGAPGIVMDDEIAHRVVE
jgi:hypothetical protein